MTNQPRRRSGLAHNVKELTDGMRAIGILRSVSLVPIALDNLDATPIGVEFVGENPRKAGADAVSHLRTVGHNVDRAVGVDPDEDAGMKRGSVD